MQVNLIPENPEEIRFVANCLLGLADLREAAGPAEVTTTQAAAPAADKKPRRGAAAEKKADPVAEIKRLTAAEAEEALFNIAAKDEPAGEASAGTAPAAEESGKPQADAPAGDEVTHDMLRQAFGAIADAAKRAEVIKGIEKLGFTSIKGITGADKLAAAYKLMVD